MCPQGRDRRVHDTLHARLQVRQRVVLQPENGSVILATLLPPLFDKSMAGEIAVPRRTSSPPMSVVTIASGTVRFW